MVREYWSAAAIFQLNITRVITVKFNSRRGSWGRGPGAGSWGEDRKDFSITNFVPSAPISDCRPMSQDRDSLAI